MAARIVEIRWTDAALFDEAPQEDLSIDVLGGEPGKLVAQATDEQIQRLRQIGFEVNVLFDSVEAFVAASGGG